MDFSEDFIGIEDHILETLGKEFTFKILKRILQKVKNK
jgi:hypothetical protein